MLTRADVECIIENVLSELTIEVWGGYFTEPNERIVKLKLGDRVLSETSFNVVERPEYEG